MPDLEDAEEGDKAEASSSKGKGKIEEVE